MNYTKKSWFVSFQEQEIFIFCKTSMSHFLSLVLVLIVLYFSVLHPARDLTVLLTVLKLQLLLQES